MVESLNSWANGVTAMRILLAPLVFLAIPEDGTGSWWAFLLWFVLCSSDGVDGYIARRRGPTHVGPHEISVASVKMPHDTTALPGVHHGELRGAHSGILEFCEGRG